jgi:2-polyprenyl-3-methyl-5-hydroxy-6-metoxy-1,4-benzoquinol methylase
MVTTNLFTRKYFQIFFLIITILLVFKITNYNKNHHQQIKNLFNNLQDRLESRNNIEIDSSLTIYDLKKPNDNSFDCIKARRILLSEPFICIHDVRKDVFVSNKLNVTGCWECRLVEIFLQMLKVNSTLNGLKYLNYSYFLFNFQFLFQLKVLDIGANIGQYSLYAASFGRSVIAIEPFYDNYIRLHKSAILTNVTNKITLLTNAVSNIKNEEKILIKNDINIAGYYPFY